MVGHKVSVMNMGRGLRRRSPGGEDAEGVVEKPQRPSTVWVPVLVPVCFSLSVSLSFKCER